MQKNENEQVVDPFKVYVRVRPLVEREMSIDSSENAGSSVKNKVAVMVEDKTIYVVDQESQELYGKKEKYFVFDDVFKEKDNNNMIFDKIVKNLVNNVVQGYNSTALAYGVTGTGKTHTMFGDIYLNLNFEKGICMFAVDYLFERIQSDSESTYKIKINYLEIYNESVIDLLVDKQSNHMIEQHLMIVEDPNKGTLVPDLTEFSVTNSEQVTNLIILGNSRRMMAPTGANQFSSRSHAILQINVEQRSKGREEYVTSKLLLVDLAGSERGGLEKGIRREEGANINKSLLALGNCINILSDKTKKGSFVPYRDSKLTRLLKDSLGGNIATIMIACISPSILSYDETINTLNYASRARKIQKKVTKNIKETDHFNAQYREIIDNLKSEIVQLKEIIKNQNILLRNRPDSFKEDRDFINLNLNLNLNINNANTNNLVSRPNLGLNSNNNNYVVNGAFPTNTANNLNNFLNDEMLSNDFTALKANFNFFDINTKKHSISEDLRNVPNSGLIIGGNNNQKVKDFNFENYEEFINKNLNQFSDNDFEDFERKLEGLYFDKINLEDQIQRGNKDSTINEKYTIVKTFYEKYIELINEKMIENIEHNMILKFNLKEILELNQINTNILCSINEQLTNKIEENEEESRLIEDKNNIEKIIEENEKEKENITRNLESNIKTKNILKNLLFRFISNTQMKEIQNLQHAFIGLENDKRELEVKNKKYQEFLTAVMKEKDEKDIKIIDLNRELEMIKKKLLEKEKLLIESGRKNIELETTIKEERYFNKTVHKSNLRTVSARRMSYNDDSELRINPYRRYYNNYISSKSKNKNINVDLCDKIPRVSAILHGAPNVTTSYNSSHNIIPISSIVNLRNNLNKKGNKSFRSRSPKKLNDFDKLVDSHMSTKFHNKVMTKNNSFKSQNNKKLISKKNLLKSKETLNIRELVRDISNNNLPKNSQQILQNNLKPTYIQTKDNVCNINPINPPNDSISISAVTYKNEACLNSSELDIVENVLNLDGINTGIKMSKKTIKKNIPYQNIPLAITNSGNTYTQQYMNKHRSVFNSSNRSPQAGINKSNENDLVEDYSVKIHKRAASVEDGKKKEKDILQLSLQKLLRQTEIINKGI